MIQMNNVAIGYNGVAIREHLWYNFSEGKIYGILGESGIGKTTFLKTIAGLLKPVSGKVVLDGITHKDIYMMHQQYTCFDWLNIIHNVMIGAKVKNGKYVQQDYWDAIDLLHKVGLEKFLTPEGEDDMYPQQLSGGQRQRLALARTLFTKPKVILMDEPLSALDDKTRESMQQLIRSHQQETKCTIVMVTHSPAEAKLLCDDIINF